MSFLSPARWLLIGAVIAALLTGWRWREHVVDQRGYYRAVSEYTTKALIAEKAARVKEQALQAITTKAIQDAQVQKNKLAVDARNLRHERDGLRDELAASRSQLSGASCASVRERAAALTDVFDQCAGAFENLAGKADGHAVDSLMLQSGWPK